MPEGNKEEGGYFTEARELFEDIVEWLNSDNVCGLEHSDLENKLLVNGNELLRRLLQGYLDRRGNEEIEGDCCGSDGIKRTHKRKQTRQLTTIFGTVVVRRIGYGGRKMSSLHPLDGELNLPPEQYSHTLSERVASAAAFNGFNQTVEIIKKTTAAQIAKRQVEEIALSSACDFDEFYQAQQAKSQPDEETGEILVISVDGKGVVMRREDLRPSTQKRAIAGQRKLKKRLTAGEKCNSKRMATVAAVYTINPFVRGAAQIVNPKPDEGIKRPRPQAKRVWASLVKEPETVIAEAFEEALSRDPHQQKHWVALVDGNQTQLRLLTQLAQKYDIRLTIVLDLIHVIEYLKESSLCLPSSQ